MPDTHPPLVSAPEPSGTPSPPRPIDSPGSGSAAAWIVHGIWAVMTGLLVFLIARYAYNIPWQDDFIIVDILTGVQPLTLRWLWGEHNEHRIPAVKLILLALCRWTGDFRAPMYLTAAGMSWLALALIRVARAWRGRTVVADAIFPLLLLHWGHAEVFLWSFEVQYGLSIVLSGIILLLGLGPRESMSVPAMVGAGICLISLPMTGANGLILVPGLACWLVILGTARAWTRGPGSRRDGFVGLGFVLAALVATAAYLTGRNQVGPVRPRPGIKQALHSSLQYLTGGFGPGISAYWPPSGLATALLVLAAGVALLARAARGPSTIRFRALGLGCFLGAMGCLVMALGWGRTFDGFGSPFIVLRYYTLAALVPCALYFVWDGPRPIGPGSCLQFALFGLVCLITPFNMQVGLNWARTHARPLEAMTREIEAGTTPAILAEHYRRYLYPPSPDEWLAGQFERLRDAKIGPFRALQVPAGGLREIPVPLGSAELVGVNRLEDADSYFGWRFDPTLRFRLPEPRQVHSIRVKCVYTSTAGEPALFELAWQRPGGGTPAHRGGRLELGIGNGFGPLMPAGKAQVDSDPRTITVLVGDTIDRLQVRPDHLACAFKLLEITLLVPDSGPTSSPAGAKP